MTFSQTVKNEIFNIPEGERHCRLAEASAIVAGAAKLNHTLTKKVNGIVERDFNGEQKKMLYAAGLLADDGRFNRRINSLVTRLDCCRRAYLGGLFLSCGYIKDPRTSGTYHAEFRTGDGDYTNDLIKLFALFELSPLILTRKDNNVLYFKDGEQIAEMLLVTGAHTALMQFEDERIRKSFGNNINRSANFDTANVDKAIAAAVKQVENIERIINASGLNSLPESLREVARIRLDNPEMSIKEIGEMLNPPVSKSGVNHRFRKIQVIGESLENLGGAAPKPPPL